MIDPPSSLAGDLPSESNDSSRVDEAIGYLFAFSEAIFDLVPDGLAVLDERLQVRAANATFLEMLGFGSIEEARGRSIADHPWLAERVELEGAAIAIGELLRDTLQTGTPVAIEGVPAPQGADAPRLAIRAIPWDADDAESRRILLWVGLEQPAAAPHGAPHAAAPETSAAEPESAALLEEKNDRIFFLTAFLDRILDAFPFGVCLLDPSLRVVADGAWMRDRMNRRNLSDSPADRHLFALYPELRGSELQSALDACRREARRARVEVAWSEAGAPLRRLAIEVEPFLPDTNAPGVLLFVREANGSKAAAEAGEPHAPAPPAREPTPAGPASLAIGSPRVLLVERDATERARLSDRLRASGFDDLAAASSGTDALVRHDPAQYDVIVLGIEPWDQEIADYARRAAHDAPRVPIVLVSSANARDVQRFLGDVPICRVIPRGETFDGLSHAILESLAIPAPQPSASISGATKQLILIGAREHDLPVLRLLYRAAGVRLRMVYDPDPEASGLALAKSLGIPAVAGNLEMRLDPTPDAVVLAREGLETHLAPLGLEGVAQITRDEVELFLVDPDSFLESESTPKKHNTPVLGDLHMRELPASAPGAKAEAPLRPEAFAAGPPSPSSPSSPPNAPTHEPWSRSVPPASPNASEERREGHPGPETERATASFGSPLALARTRSADLDAEVGGLLRALDLLLDFQRLADWVLDVALRVAGGASGSVMLVQEDKPVLAIVASKGLKDIAARHRRQRVGEGIAGRVAEDGEPLLLVGTLGDPKIKPISARPEIRSSVSVPVLSDGHLIGVLNVNSDPASEPFDDATLGRVTSFGRQIGGPLSRSLQLRRMRGRSFEHSMRAEIETIASQPADLGSKLRQVVERVAQVTSADSCAIYLIDRERKHLDLEAAFGVSSSSMEAYRIPVGTGVVGWVAKSRRPLVLRNPEEEAGDPQPTSMAFPVRHQTDLLGVLSIEASQPLATEDDRLALVDSIASAIGALIADARVTEDSTKMVTMLSALSELGLAFGAASNLEGLARLVAFTASTVLESDVCLVRLRRPGSQGSHLDDFELLASHGASIPLEVEPLGQLEAKLVSRGLAAGEPCRDLDLPLADAEPLLRQSNVFTAMAVPIISSRETLGSIVVARVSGAAAKETGYGTSEVEIGSRLGDYAAAAARKFLRGGSGDDDADREEEAFE